MAVDDIERFRDRYSTSGDAAVLAAEADTLGTDYRANGYTTRAQADEIAEMLALGPGDLLLDVGAGCGWPGLYFATGSGCGVISLDPVIEGIRVAKERGEIDGLAGRSWTMIASADAIPLRPRTVDAVVQTDVLC